jgi:hypothetical protein
VNVAASGEERVTLNCVDSICAKMLNGGASKELASDYRLWFGVGYRVRLEEEYSSDVAPEPIAS